MGYTPLVAAFNGQQTTSPVLFFDDDDRPVYAVAGEAVGEGGDGLLFSGSPSSSSRFRSGNRRTLVDVITELSSERDSPTDRQMPGPGPGPGSDGEEEGKETADRVNKVLGRVLGL